MAAAAATAGDRRRRSRAPAGGAAAGNDDGEEQHLNPFLDAAPSASSRVQFRWVSALLRLLRMSSWYWLLASVTRPLNVFCGDRRRNVASRARWVEEVGAAEVVESKGKLWMTTGVTRGGKLCYNIEETGYATCSMKCRSCSIIRFLVVFICTGPLIMVVMVCFASSTGSLSFAA